MDLKISPAMLAWLGRASRRFRRAEQVLLVVGGAFALSIFLHWLDFNMLESTLYDSRMAKGFQAKPDSRIVLVQIDDATTRSLEEFTPMPLTAHVRLLELLAQSKARAIGYVADFARIHQLNPELFKTGTGQKFVEVVHSIEAHGTPVLLGSGYDVTGEVIPAYPLSTLSHSIAMIHKDGNVFSQDKVTRRALVRAGRLTSFHVNLAEKAGLLNERNRTPRGTYTLSEIDADYFFFRYHGKPEQNPYRTISALDLLEGKVKPHELDGKLVLVGTLSKEDATDFVFTPYSKVPFTQPRLVVHANILDSVINGEGIVRAPTWVSFLFTLIFTAGVLTFALILQPLSGVAATVAAAAVFGVLAHLLFQGFGLWIRESQTLTGIFLAYYLMVPYRLTLEYRKRWELERENEILTQVEELKMNFMSLVTHDLKTPVARIQGLTEVLLRKAAERLNERDKETLTSILGSTEELNRFISSILELSKIDSNRLQLRLESRDVNQLLEKSVETFKAPAKARDIKIHTNLEPLFPIKIDAELVSKILNNLIDNALKYSPEHSTITVESREEADWVLISVADQGIGMTEEERKNLFTRFYRAKNDSTVKIIGTGLGLYLSKYFVEAHGGSVEVTSEPGQGSKFTIKLPVAGAAPGLLTQVGSKSSSNKKEQKYV